jgi:hypothetical protein
MHHHNIVGYHSDDPFSITCSYSVRPSLSDSNGRSGEDRDGRRKTYLVIPVSGTAEM